MATPNTPGGRRRRLRSLQRKLTALDHELAALSEENDEERDEERKAEADRRKFLAGHVVLDRVQQRVQRIPWLRGVLDVGLTRAYDRAMFRLAGGGPLIPPEEWPGWPDTPGTEPSVGARPRTRMTPGRRRARIAFLQERRKTIFQQLDELIEETAPERETKNHQRKIVAGAVMLTMSFQKKRVHQWLRKLLDDHLTAVRDRKLFQLQGDGPLVPEEERATLRLTRRERAPKRASDNSPSAADDSARNPGSTSQNANRSGHVGSSTAGGAVPSRERESAGNATPPDARDPIPGWRPYRLSGASSSSSGVRTLARSGVHASAAVLLSPRSRRSFPAGRSP